jgi:hypothetical protein
LVSRGFGTTISDVAGIYDSLLRKGSFPERAVMPIATLLPADSPRSHGEDQEHIKRLAECGAQLPPILVQRGTMRVIDGMHRLRAVLLNGCHSIEVEFFDGCDEDAFIRGVEQNVAHGLPLTLSDRRAAAARILGWRPALSDRSVAGMTGLSPKTVGAIRARASEEIPHSNARQGRDGRLRPLDSSAGRLRAAEVIRANPDASLRQIAASAGISAGTARSVQARLRAGEDPVRGRPQGPEPVVEIGAILQKLYRDPALRHSDAGRRLLQLIRAKSVDGTLRVALRQESPPHSRSLLARLARANAGIWLEIANELEKQSPKD